MSVPMKEAIASNTPPPMPSDCPCLPGNRAEEQGARSSRHNHNCHSTISPSSHTRSPGTSFQREFNQAMANFPVDPLPFIPPGIEIDDGRPHRVSRAVVTLSSNVVHTHEEYVLAIDTQQMSAVDDIHPFMHHVPDHINEVFHLPVWSVCCHPFGIGLYQLDTTIHKDLLFSSNPHNIDGIEVTFVSHDHALNRRNWV
jgi:hypothetical protein